MKRLLFLCLTLALCIYAYAQSIQRTTGDTLVIDGNNNLITAPLTKGDYGTWRKIWLNEDRVNWQEVIQTPWRVFAYGESVKVGKRYHNRICVTVVDSNGVSITDAVVRYKKTLLKYDANEMAYVFTMKKKDNASLVVDVEYNGMKREVSVNHNERYYYSDYYDIPYQYRRNYLSQNSSWLVTDKNMYKPGDTIKWKIVGVNGENGKQLKNDSIHLNIRVNYNKSITLFSGPLNDRGVAFGSVLLDTLKLTANRSYQFCCEYIKTNAQIASTYFYYKDYELKDVVVSCKADKTTYLWGDSIRLIFNVNDEKGDYLDNGTVKCKLNISNISRIYEEYVWFINDLTDTLTAKIHNGVAEIVVPTDKWLKADYYIWASWNFRSADGMERQGSLYFNYQRDPIPETPVVANQTLDIKDFNTINTADSIGFSAIAPVDPTTGKSRPFHWVIYRNAKFYSSGVDTILNWRKAESANSIYYCFISGEGIVSNSQRISHGKYGLNVEVVQRKTVVPGSSDEIIVKVTDNNGKPVQGVDITALGYTKKLGRNLSMPMNWVWYKQKYERTVNNIDGAYKINAGDSVIKEPWLIKLLRAESTQYWQLAHNNTDDVRMIKSPSSVKSPQIVPVLVCNGEIVPISRLDIDYEQAWVTGTNDRYSFALKNGTSHSFSFYVGDSIYTKVVNNLSIKDNEKAWISVPLTSCNKHFQYGSEYLMQNEINVRRVPVTIYTQRGVGYLESSNDLIRRVSDTNKAIFSRDMAGNGDPIQYKEMRLDGPTASFPFNLYCDEVSYYSASRALVLHDKCSEKSRKLSKKELKKFVAERSLPSLDDSICTLEELKKEWVSRVDNRRSSSIIYNGHSINRNNTRLYLLYGDEEERPVNIIYKAVGDTLQYIVNGNYNRSIAVYPEKRYELTFLYKDARVRRLMVDVHTEGNHYVKATLDSSMTIEHNAKTIAFEDSIRHLYENIMGDGVLYNPGPYDYMGFDEDGELDEVVVLAYGTSTRKSKPMMMKSAAGEVAGIQVANTDGQPGVNSTVRIRGVGSVYADADYAMNGIMEEEIVEEEITIRDNFNDVAFWQPDLVTDKNGEVRFTITYPDDLTEWREAFVAIKGKQRGYAMSSVIARKDEVAKLKMPRFAIVGDSVSAIGTGVNYVTGASAVDTLHAVAEGDSLCMQYVFGHDGEKRCSPIYKQGMEARDANFYILEGDTSFTLKYNTTIASPMEVNVYTDIRETLLESVETLAKSDWCGSNDYLALRLQAMRMVADSDYTKKIDEIEKKLLANRMENGFWCWYGRCDNTGSSSLWVTEQVLSALGGKAVITNNFLATLGSYFIIYRNQHNWSSMFEVAKLFDLVGDTLQRDLRLNEIPADSLAKYDRSAYIEYQMMLGKEVKFDTMRHRTYTGGEYYTLNPKRHCCWFNPVYEQIETSLLAYKYYTNKGDVARCRAIKLWLLQYVRRSGRFGISLSESLSLKIVKALWQDEKIGLKDVLYQLSINDKSAYELPYSMVVTDDAKLEYKGKRTLYISTEQKYWDNDPDVVSNGMTIKSEYVSGTIKVDITLEADAEYLILSIPIPAGCSYDENRYSYTRGETHREEYKDRVNILCERIGEGTHHFEVKLNERFPGVYTVNPSEVRLIYFPAFNANNKKTKVNIR